MDQEMIYEFIVIGTALIGTYVKMNIEITKITSRVLVLEQSTGEVSKLLRKLHEDLNEIKLLLARKHLDQ